MRSGTVVFAFTTTQLAAGEVHRGRRTRRWRRGCPPPHRASSNRAASRARWPAAPTWTPAPARTRGRDTATRAANADDNRVLFTGPVPPGVACNKTTRPRRQSGVKGELPNEQVLVRGDVRRRGALAGGRAGLLGRRRPPGRRWLAQVPEAGNDVLQRAQKRQAVPRRLENGLLHAWPPCPRRGGPRWPPAQSSRSTCAAASAEARAASSDTFCRLATIGRTSCSKRLAISPTRLAARNAATMARHLDGRHHEHAEGDQPEEEVGSSEQADPDVQVLLRVGLDGGDQRPHLVDRAVHVLIQLPCRAAAGPACPPPAAAPPTTLSRRSVIELSRLYSSCSVISLPAVPSPRLMPAGDRIEVGGRRRQRLGQRVVVQQLAEAALARRGCAPSPPRGSAATPRAPSPPPGRWPAGRACRCPWLRLRATCSAADSSAVELAVQRVVGEQLARPCPGRPRMSVEQRGELLDAGRRLRRPRRSSEPAGGPDGT